MTDRQDDREWWKPSELAERWRCSTDTIIRRIGTKKIRAMRVGSMYRIHRSEIARHEDAALGPPPQPTPARRRRRTVTGAEPEMLAHMERDEKERNAREARDDAGIFDEYPAKGLGGRGRNNFAKLRAARRKEMRESNRREFGR